MDSTILQRLLSQLTPDQVSQLMTETQGGRMTNPRLLRLMQMSKERSMSDSDIPNRFIMRNDGRGMAMAGVLMPPSRIANAYRGQPLQGVPRPEMPELYMPGVDSGTWIRGL